MEPKYNVAICGGGNLAHGSIATIGHQNPKYKISMYSRRPEVWSKEIVGYTKGSSWEYKGNLKGKLDVISNDPAKVVSDADIVLVCSPAQTKNQILKEIKPFLKKGAMVGTIFGQGAFDLQCKFIFGDDFIKQQDITIFSF